MVLLSRRRRAGWVPWMGLVVLVVVACGDHQSPRVVRDRIEAFETVVPQPPRVLPVPAAVALDLLESEPFEVERIEPLQDGVTGAARATITFPRQDQSLEVKWKVVPPRDADGWNNTPRKELAAYAVQRWFLEPGDFVVPPTALRCVPLARYRRFEPDTEASIDGSTCVLGLLSVWLQGVEIPETLWDPERFLREPRYAAHRADFNLFTYLVEHRDGRDGNFLVPSDPTDLHVFSVDNGIAFGGLIYNYLVTNWDTLHVPALRRASVERLRRLDPAALEALLVVAELRADADGVLRPVPPGPVADPELGTRVDPGHIQLGLTRAEVDAIAERRTRLLEQVDHGEVPVF